MHNRIGDRTASPVLPRPPRLREPGEDVSRGWSIVADTWVYCDGRTIGVHPIVRGNTDVGYTIRYETVEQTAWNG